jgi:actin-like ATPase involved in cell morphogenesis
MSNEFKVVYEGKEPNILAVDFGTLFAKCSIMKDSVWMEDLVVIPNKIFEISEGKAKTLRQESKDEINIPTGLFTQKEIEDAKLLFQADEVFVQSDALPSDTSKLEKAYQNVCEQLDKEFNFSGNEKITANYKDWAVISAVAAFETAEARETVEGLHKRSTKKMGFKAIYINNQIMFDYFSQINYLKQIGAREGYCTIINIGGGDTEVGGVSGIPIQESFRRFNIGGQDITKYCQTILQERYNIVGTAYGTIEEWLHEGGTCDGDAAETKKNFKRKEIDIKDILNTPEMLFDYAKYWKKERRFNSITQVVVSSIEGVLEKSEVGVELLLGAVLVVGGASRFNGLTQRLQRELAEEFPEYKDQINVLVGEDPQNSGINGIRGLVSAKYGDKQKGLKWVNLQAEEPAE